MNVRQALAWVAWAACCAAQGQSLRADSTLADAPNGAPKTPSVKSGTAVKVLRRDGFWLEVDAGGRTGWVRASAIVLGSGGGAVAIDTGRLGSGNIVATSVSRGLSAKDLISGKPDFDQVTRLEALSAEASTVQGFVNQGHLQPPSEKVSLLAPRAPAPLAGSASTPNQAKGSQDDW